MSVVVWESLNDQEKTWIQDAVDASVEYQKRLWQEACEVALREVQEAGVTVTYPDKASFREAVREMHRAYRDQDPSIYNLIQEISRVK